MGAKSNKLKSSATKKAKKKQQGPIAKRERHDLEYYINVYAPKLSKLLRVQAEDCALCIQQPLLAMMFWSGQLPLSYNCPHTGHDQRTYFRKNISFMIINWGLAFWIATDIFQMLHQIITEEFSETVTIESKLECLPEVWYALAVLTIQFFRTTNVQWKSYEYEGIARMIAAKRHYGMTKLFDDRFKLFMQIFNMGSYFNALFFPIGSGIIQWADSSCPKNMGCSFQRNFMTFLYIYIQLLICLELTQCFLIYMHLFKKCHKQVKDVLKERIKHARDKEGSDEVAWKRNRGCRRMLNNLQHMHSSIILNVRFHNGLLNPMYFIWLAMDCAIMIFNLYLLVYASRTGSFSHYYWYTTLRNTVHVVALVIYYGFVSYVDDVMLARILDGEDAADKAAVESKLECVPEVMYAAAVFVIQFFRTAKVHRACLEHEGLSALIASKRKCGLKQLFGDRFKVLLKCVNIFCFTLCVLLPFGSELLQYFNVDCPRIFDCTVYRCFMTYVHLYVQLIFSLDEAQLFLIYIYLFKKCHWQVKQVLRQRVKYANNGGCCTRMLRNLRNMHSSIVLNVQLHNSFLDPMYTVWSLIERATIVFNVYMFVNAVKSGSFSDYYWFNTVRNVNHILAMIVSSAMMSYFDTVGNDIVSFLFKFPISKLNAAEAAQVEMMLTTFIMQKPTLRASDIFTIGTGILTSVTGTVITYVLVIIQFTAEWSTPNNGQSMVTTEDALHLRAANVSTTVSSATSI